MLRLILSLGITACTMPVIAMQSYYCPQNHGYINTGMSKNQVMAACGTPLSKETSNRPVMQQVPVQQLFFNNQGSQHAFYGVWSLPVGNEGGAQLEVDIVNYKVSNIRINGSNSNAFSICGGRNIGIGSTIGQVYSACGNPSLINNTFINQMVQTNQKPEIWVYQSDPYRPPVSLTFVDGKLQSID